MSRRPKILAFEATYHRNGSFGEAFYLCSFRDARDGRLLRAVFYPETDRNYTAVFDADPLQSLNRFDGFYYHHAIEDAIEVQQAINPSLAHRV